MLQSMRHLAHSWLFKGLMLLLVISFGIWGIGDMFRGNPLHKVVAKVGNATITVQELNREFEQSLARARQMFGPEMTAQQAKQMGLLDHALETLIENSLVDQDLKRLGIDADDKAVLQELTQDPQFRDKDGHFDKNIFHNLLAQARVNERDFLNQQRKNLASRQLVNAVTTTPPEAQSVIDTLYKARGQKRILDVVTLDEKSIRNIEAPDDKTLHDFYAQNPQPFTVPEQRGITIAILSTDDIAKDIKISDDEVRKTYDSKGNLLAEPEKRDLLQVVLQDESKAKELAKAAQASGNIATAAEAMGRQVVPLNNSDAASLLPELATPVFAMKKGEVSEPIKTALGWHVIQVRKITTAGIPAYDAIKESLRDSMQRDQAVDTTTKLVNQLDDELAAGHPLEDVADGMRLRMIKIPAVDSNGKTPDGKDPTELPHKDDVLKQAFSQNSGEVSPVIDDKSGSYYVIRTDNVTPSAVKPFENVKAEVLTAWKAAEQTKRAAAEAEDIAKTLRDGKPLSSLASREGVETHLSKPISMLGDYDAALPKSSLPHIMRLKKGEVTVIPDKNKQIILRLASITPVTGAMDDAAAGKIKSELDTSAPKELADEYLHYLRVVFPVTIHHDAVDSVAQQGG